MGCPVSLEESIDATTATGRLILNVLVSVSQWKRKVIGEWTKEAMGYLKADQRVSIWWEDVTVEDRSSSSRA